MDGSFRLLPEQASTMAPRVDALFWFLVAVTAFFTVVVAVLLFYFALRYRRRSDDFFPKPFIGSRKLEVTWMLLALGLFLFIFLWGASVFLDIRATPEDALEVYVTGRQWMWHTQHAGGQREINALHVPVGRKVRLIMTSEDVIHNFSIPAFRVKRDVIPGSYTEMWFEPTQAGRYHLFCVQYCGTEHSRMVGEVVVLEPAEYEQWLAQRADRSLATQGRQLFQKLQCVSCHHADAGNRAPLLEGIYNKEVELQGGRRVRATESYLRESILYPAAKVRQGYRPIMPPYKGQVSEDEMVRLLAFLKALGPGGTPSRVEHSEAPAVNDQDE